MSAMNLIGTFSENAEAKKKKVFCTFLQPALMKYQFVNNFLEFLF